MQKVIVSGIIEHDDKLLVVKRSKSQTFFPEFYEFPGGKLEFAEDPNSAVIREVMEETGLDTSILRIFSCRSYLSKNKTQHNVELFYCLQLKSVTQVKVILSAEHEAYLWVDLMNIHETNLPLTDPIYILIYQYFENKIKAENNL